MPQKKSTTTSKKTTKKRRTKKPKVYIPAYKIIILCASIITICMALLLVTTVKSPESSEISQRFEEEKKTEQVKEPENIKSENITFIITDGKKHNPHYTIEAVNYLNEVFGNFAALCQNQKIKTLEDKTTYFSKVDWLKITEQDDIIWGHIYNFIK